MSAYNHQNINAIHAKLETYRVLKLQITRTDVFRT